ncbi:MAG TPA: AraC family transcriptional regulator [Aquella sp.]|nr:AraC family transcriptional regulator [Aquella sp.]
MKQISDLDNMSTGIFGVASPSLIKDFHSHEVSQLSIPVNGVMNVLVDDNLFIIPPGMAIFIPKNTKHCVQKINDRTIIENIFFTDIYKNYLPKAGRSFYLSPLAAAIISKICTFKIDAFSSKKVINLISVLLDELDQKSMLNYSLKIPKSPPLFKIYKLFVESIDYLPSLTDAAKLINVSSRTLQRMFQNELGISFVLWKQQLTFIKSLELLMQGKSTTVIAYKLGYNSDSAFITMFKKMSGGKLPSTFFNH